MIKRKCGMQRRHILRTFCYFKVFQSDDVAYRICDISFNNSLKCLLYEIGPTQFKKLFCYVNKKSVHFYVHNTDRCTTDHRFLVKR